MKKRRLNINLAMTRDLSASAYLELTALHHALDMMEENHQDNGPWDEEDQADIIQTVLMLEYRMQELWDFPKAMAQHTHYERFDIDSEGYNACLTEKESELSEIHTYPSSYPIT